MKLGVEVEVESFMVLTLGLVGSIECFKNTKMAIWS